MINTLTYVLILISTLKIIRNSMYELKGKLHLYKCMHSDNTKFKMFIYTQYNGNMRQIILLLTALYF